jgi:hypothetical protein
MGTKGMVKLEDRKGVDSFRKARELEIIPDHNVPPALIDGRRRLDEALGLFEYAHAHI